MHFSLFGLYHVSPDLFYNLILSNLTSLGTFDPTPILTVLFVCSNSRDAYMGYLGKEEVHHSAFSSIPYGEIITAL